MTRAEQKEIPGWAEKFRTRKKAEKAAKTKEQIDMCGIVGIAGTRDVAPVILDALKRLEYRGYDSAGIATLVDGHIERRRSPGKLDRSRRRAATSTAAGPHRHRPHALGDAWRADRDATLIRTPPRASRSCTTASSRISASCATN